MLLAGNDIPFEEAQITIHQPILKEIGYIGEEAFFTGYQMINISKNLFSEEDKKGLDNYSDFDILIAILRERNAVMQKNRNCVIAFLSLLFPGYQFNFEEKEIIIFNEKEKHLINNDNFDIFKTKIKNMLLSESSKADEVNPSGEMAKRIAEKLQKRRQKLAEQESGDENVDVITRYASILAIGTNIDLNVIMNFTLYQLFDQFERYQLKLAYDIYVKAKMAGAQDSKEVEDWMKSIHSKI